MPSSVHAGAPCQLCAPQDALLACAEAAKLFIHYLTATANDACKDAKRQTISADDVTTVRLGGWLAV